MAKVKTAANSFLLMTACVKIEMMETDERRLYRDFADALMRLRAERNLSGHELANQLGISFSHVYDLEAGRRRPSAALIKRVRQWAETAATGEK